MDAKLIEEEKSLSQSVTIEAKKYKLSIIPNNLLDYHSIIAYPSLTAEWTRGIERILLLIRLIKAKTMQLLNKTREAFNELYALGITNFT